jgi:hypothetical protein
MSANYSYPAATAQSQKLKSLLVILAAPDGYEGTVNQVFAIPGAL